MFAFAKPARSDRVTASSSTERGHPRWFIDPVNERPSNDECVSNGSYWHGPSRLAPVSVEPALAAAVGVSGPDTTLEPILDMASVRRLFEQHGPMVYRRALRILGNRHDAEEALQDVFLRVLRDRERFESRSRVTTWLYCITTNHCLNVLRDGRRRQALREENLTAAGLDPEPATSDSLEALFALREVLGQADEQHARAAVYVYLDGMSHDEAARLLGVSRRTVGNLLARLTEHVITDQKHFDRDRSCDESEETSCDSQLLPRTGNKGARLPVRLDARPVAGG